MNLDSDEWTAEQNTKEWLRADNKRLREALEPLTALLAPKMGEIDFYMGPNARSLIGHETVEWFKQLREALNEAHAALLLPSEEWLPTAQEVRAGHALTGMGGSRPPEGNCPDCHHPDLELCVDPCPHPSEEKEE